jgi:urease alpha subunit
MKRAFLLILLVILPGLLFAQPKQNPQSKPFVFTHVTIIDATGSPARLDMTVVVIGDRIARIGPTRKVRVPQDAHVVDASGKFLIPGLWDMHVHWFLKDYLPLFIANGVTGVRQMWGTEMHHTWRTELEKGTLLSPRMVIASSIVDGPKPTSYCWMLILCKTSTTLKRSML